MATDILEATPAPFTSIVLQEEEKDYAAGEDLSEQMLATSSLLPRCEERMESRRACSYEVQEVVDGESVVVNRGETVALNRSEDGVLLVMNRAPHTNQIIEVHTHRGLLRRTAHVYEARWTKSVQMESFGEVYLVGCRRVLGPCHYISF